MVRKFSNPLAGSMMLHSGFNTVWELGSDISPVSFIGICRGAFRAILFSLLYLLQRLCRFPASGARDRPSGALIVAGANGHSWSSSSYGVGHINGANLNFNSSNVNALNNNNRGYGLQVRCVQELMKFCAVTLFLLIEPFIRSVVISITLIVMDQNIYCYGI